MNDAEWEQGLGFTMVKSMTGFGRTETEENGRRMAVEIKAVNHRYLDENIKMPRNLAQFEAALRNVLKEYIERGKVDVYVSFEDLSEKACSVRYNKHLAEEYLGYLKQMAEDFGLENDIRVSSLSRYPDVLTTADEAEDEDELWQLLEKTARSSAEKFVKSREAEGANLKKDLLFKLDEMSDKVEQIEKHAPEVINGYQTRLKNKIDELLAGSDAKADEGRIITEVGIYADKICVDEETVRLRSHIKAVREELEKDGPVGRKLDFLAQELNREANTTLSKAGDLEISNLAIGLKTDIEKIREQVQNIE